MDRHAFTREYVGCDLRTYLVGRSFRPSWSIRRARRQVGGVREVVVKHGLFGVLDGFVRRRLRAILRKQAKRPGIGRCKADHQRWPNAFFATHGLFTLQAAYQQARHSR
jgi:hypothetical protein